MGNLKDSLTADLHAAMKAQESLTTSTLRMVLAAVRNAEVAGAQARELSDDEVLAVLTKEAKKRRDAATAFADAGRAEQASKEQAEGELIELVAGALSAGGFAGRAQLGQAMKVARAAVGGRADGARVAVEVRRQLAV